MSDLPEAIDNIESPDSSMPLMEPNFPAEHVFDIVPLVYNDNTDTSVVQNVLLIENTVQEYQQFVNGCNANTFPIVYDYHSDRNELKSLLTRKFSNIQRIAFVFHNAGMNGKLFLNNQCFFTQADLETQDNFSENFQVLVDIIRDFGVGHVDYLACNSLQYDKWKQYYEVLKTTANVVIGASNDATGNLQYGGDWVMESSNEDIKSMYFNDNIEVYQYLLAYPVYNTYLNNYTNYTTGDGTYTNITSVDDGFWSIVLTNPFTFNNTNYSTIYVNSNGLITFGAGTGTYNSQSNTYNINGIFAFHVDMFTREPGYIRYKELSNTFEVIYNNVYYSYGPAIQVKVTLNLNNNLNPGVITIDYGNIINYSNNTVIAVSFGTNNSADSSSINFFNPNQFSYPVSPVQNIINNQSQFSNKQLVITPNNTIQTRVSPTITFSLPSNKKYGDASFMIQDLSSNSPADFSYNSSNTAVATISTGKITIVGAGETTITVKQDACGNYTDGSANAVLKVTDNIRSGLSNNNNIYVKQLSSDNSIWYSSQNNSDNNTTGWIQIPDTSCNITNTNATPNETNRLVVTFLTNITIRNVNNYFVIGSDYVTVDGNNKMVTVSGCSNYLGLIQNGTSTIPGKSNIIVQNVKIQASGSSVNLYGGWICQQYFCNGSSGTNTITNCTNIANIDRSYAGGIAGSSFAANAVSGSINTIKNCTNSGTISGTNAGGIAGSSFAANAVSGSINTIKNCTNSGTISGTNSAGIVGTIFAHMAHVNSNNTISNCYTLYGTIGIDVASRATNIYMANGSWSTANALKYILIRDPSNNYVWAYQKDPSGNDQINSPFLLYSLNPSNSPVSEIRTTINLKIPKKIYRDFPFRLDASSTNTTSPFTYSSSDNNIATVSGDIVTILNAGTAIITASQPEMNGFTDGSATAILTINTETPSTINYYSTVPLKKYTVTIGESVLIKPRKYNTTDNDQLWNITPSLPAGLIFSKRTGKIRGTPVSTMDPTTYTVWHIIDSQVYVKRIILEIVSSPQ